MLASVIFLSYRQRAFVGEALSSLLAQDAEGYEIIIGDDGSDDGTLGVIGDVLSKYGGAVRVKFAPAAPNMGVVANFNRCVDIAAGDVVIAAAGDDIAMPDRVSRAILAHSAHPACLAVYGNARVIDASGATLRERWNGQDSKAFHTLGNGDRGLLGGLRFCGATASYRRDLFRIFGPVPHGPIGEDSVMAFRAILAGGAVVMPETSVGWRWHGSNLSIGRRLIQAGWRAKLLRAAAWPAKQRSHCKAYLRDIEAAARHGLLAPDMRGKLEQEVRREWHLYSMKIHSAHPKGRYCALLRHGRLMMTMDPRPSRALPAIAKALAKRLLPGPVRAFFLHDLAKG